MEFGLEGKGTEWPYYGYRIRRREEIVMQKTGTFSLLGADLKKMKQSKIQDSESTA